MPLVYDLPDADETDDASFMYSDEVNRLVIAEHLVHERLFRPRNGERGFLDFGHFIDVEPVHATDLNVSHCSVPRAISLPPQRDEDTRAQTHGHHS